MVPTCGVGELVGVAVVGAAVGVAVVGAAVVGAAVVGVAVVGAAVGAEVGVVGAAVGAEVVGGGVGDAQEQKQGESPLHCVSIFSLSLITVIAVARSVQP